MIKKPLIKMSVVPVPGGDGGGTRCVKCARVCSAPMREIPKKGGSGVAPESPALGTTAAEGGVLEG